MSNMELSAMDKTTNDNEAGIGEAAGAAVAAPAHNRFETLLAAFVTATQTTMEMALELSHIAITTFADNGNLSYAQRFLDAMPLNFHRKMAFIEWLRAFSPCKVEGTLAKNNVKLTKDKSPTARPFNVAKALGTPYWNFLPEKDTINFDTADVLKAMKRTVAKYRGTRYHAKSDNALHILATADQMIRRLEDTITTPRLPAPALAVVGGVAQAPAAGSAAIN